jgi:hypothetical protein
MGHLEQADKSKIMSSIKTDMFKYLWHHKSATQKRYDEIHTLLVSWKDSPQGESAAHWYAACSTRPYSNSAATLHVQLESHLVGLVWHYGSRMILQYDHKYVANKPARRDQGCDKRRSRPLLSLHNKNEKLLLGKSHNFGG